MIYNNVRHECNLYNFFFAPRGNRRVMELGRKITQMYLNPFDKIIGIIGAKGPSIVYLCEVSGSDLYVCADQWGQWDRKGICG